MKALIISDKQEIIDSVKTYLSDNNCDIIIYRWLLKALDNIEEIQPDIIFLSACEYPRHWKTLASFVQSGIGGNAVRVFLYQPDPLSVEDKEKAQNLGISGFVYSLKNEELSKIFESSPKAAKEPEKVNYELIFTEPKTGKFVFGKACSFDNSDEFTCTLSSCVNIKENEIIQYITVFDSKTVKSFSARVIEINSSDIKLKAINYYEEEI